MSVVVCSIGQADVSRCLRSVVESATLAGADLDLVVVWQSQSDPPELPSGARLVPAFPAGVAYARNKGLSEARAPVVAFIDDDEVADPTWVAALLQSLDHPDARVPAVFGSVEPLDDEGRPYCNYSGEERQVFESRRTPPWVVGTEGNMAFRTGCLRSVGGFDLTFGIGAPGLAGEGADLIMRMLSGGTPVEFAPDMIVYHPSKAPAEHLASRYPYGFGMGKVIRHHRDPVLGAKYATAGLHYLMRGVRERDRQVRAEAIRTLRGFSAAVAGRNARSSPTAHLSHAPGEIATLIGRTAVAPLPSRYEGRPHFVYRAADAILHLHASPSAELLSARHDRIRIENGVELDGLPRVRFSSTREDALWVLEDLIAGDPISPGAASEWYPAALAWAGRLAGGTGRPLADTAAWSSERSALVASVLPSLTEEVDAALDVVSRLRSVHAHGRFQRPNLLLDRGRIGVIGWAGAQFEGIPGDDILLLTATASGADPDSSVLRDLVDGREPPFGTPLRALAEVGVDRDNLVPLLLVLLARWRMQERARASFPGGRPAPHVYGRLFEELAPELAARFDR